MNIKKVICGFKQRIIRFKASLTKKDIVVLMFHEVCSLDKSADPSLAITFSTFEKVILTIKKDRLFTSPDQILRFDKKMAIITFDDAYSNIMEEAVPFLIKEKIPFTVFVCQELLGKSSYLSKEDIKFLKTIPLCSIEFHSQHHSFVTHLNESEFLSEISCDHFNQEHGLNCRYLAYPYGSVYSSYRSDLDKINSQYELAFSTIDSWFSFSYAKKNKYFLPRMNVSERTFETFLKRIKK